MKEISGWIEIFIYLGYKFKVLDKFIINFYLLEFILIMLVSVICGKDNVLNVYNEVVKERYRFFSFGDVMIIKQGGNGCIVYKNKKRIILY